MILAVAQVVETSITSPAVHHVLLATPLAANECLLCEKSIVYYHVDHRVGVNKQYCSSCHQVWLELNWEKNRQSNFLPTDCLLTWPPSSNEQQHAVDGSSIHINKELMTSPPSRTLHSPTCSMRSPRGLLAVCAE